MIKKLCSIFCMSLALVSCLDNADSQYTPHISTSVFTCNTTDTLLVRPDINGYRLDTVSLGDTVRFVVEFNALSNNLLTARIAWDSLCTKLTIGKLDSITNVLLPSSEPDAGVFNLPTGYQAIVLPVEFVAIKAGSPTLVFTAESDSKYSPAEVKLKTPIK